MPLAIRRVPIAIRRIPKILTSLSLVALLYIASLSRYQNLFHLIIGNYTSDLNFKGPVAHNETSTSDASNASRDGGDASACPVGSKPVENYILPESTKHGDTRIPKIIHFIIRDKSCVPEIIHESLSRWKQFSNHSIIIHDQYDVDNYLSKTREDLPHIPNAAKCAIEAIAKYDLARLLILWDHGGIVADIDTMPAPNLLVGNKTIIAEKDDCILELVDLYPHSNPRFIGCIPKHYFIYSLIQRSIANHHLQFSQGRFNNRTYYNQRNSIFEFVLSSEFTPTRDDFDELKFKAFSNHPSEIDESLLESVTLMNSRVSPDPFLIDIDVNDSIKEYMELVPSSTPVCVKMDNHLGGRIDLEPLFAIASNTTNATICNSNYSFIEDTLLNPRMTDNTRRIPKIVYTTSNSRCVPDLLAQNVNQWRFDNHSFLFFDDDAVNRLVWDSQLHTEFPLLPSIRPCVNSGASLADLWRYVLLWEYGGIITEIGTVPEELLVNGTLIEENTDFLVEQESGGGGFVDQYFLAASPRHPYSYFMVQIAIQRLLEVQIVNKSYSGIVTGPGAAKMAMMNFVGGTGYPHEGDHTGVSNRNITVLQSKRAARKVLTMNLPHNVSIPTSKGDEIRHSCMLESYKQHLERSRSINT